MMNSDDDKGGEGRGLPRGWGWREDEDGFALRLYPPGCGSLDYSAAVYRDGSFIAYRDARGSDEIASEDRDEPRTPETIAAAQAAAEAALWRCDGYGTGEVRGRFVAHGQGFGLPGRWRTKAVRAVPGGHEVDAVREGGVEVDAVRAPVPVDKAARAWASISQIGEDGSHPADGASAPAEPAPRPRPMPPVAPGAGRGEGDEEDEPDPCAKHDTAGSNIGWQVWCPGCNVALHREPAPREPSAPTCPRALPCTRLDPHHVDDCTPEPSAPTDGELARLLADLPHRIAYARQAARDDEPLDAAIRDLADGAALLLADRERMAGERDRWKEATHKLASESACEVDAEIVALRARVAELEEMVEGGDREARNQRDRADEAERKLSAVAAEWKEMDASLSEAKEQLRIVSAGPDDVWRWAGDGGDDPASLACPVVMSAETLREFVAARERVAALEATPPPHTVAALLARVEEAASASGASAAKIEAEDGEDAADYQSGHAHGMGEAASLIRATLGAPSPLETVVAEVCALPVEMPTFYASVDSVEDGLHAVDMLIGDHELPRRDRLARIARVALAGMLACDAAKGGDT